MPTQKERASKCYQKNKARFKAANQAWVKANPEKRATHSKRYSLKHCYGMSLAEYDKMEVEQGSSCAICREMRKLNVDHDHRTGRVRALLCQRCNIVVGHLESSPHIYKLALEYLGR